MADSEDTRYTGDIQQSEGIYAISLGCPVTFWALGLVKIGHLLSWHFQESFT